MISGKITRINNVKNLFCIEIDEDKFVIVEYYDENDFSLNDLLVANKTLGDVFIQNETKNKFFQAKIRYLGYTEKKMKKMMEL